MPGVHGHDRRRSQNRLLCHQHGQRSELLPSERAAGYKALAEVLRLEGNGAVNEVAKIGSEGKRTVYRYMRLVNLEKPLLDKVDKKEISVYAGAALADLTPTAQMNLLARAGAARSGWHHRESRQGSSSSPAP